MKLENNKENLYPTDISTEGNFVFLVLSVPRSSVESTTMVQSMQSSASTPSICRRRLRHIVRSQGQNENQENQNAFLLSNLGTTLQVMVPTYTACLSIFKMMTTSVSLTQKAEILITVNLKSPKEGCTKTPKTTRSLLINIIGQQSTFLMDVN